LKDIKFRTTKNIEKEKLLALYSDAGWSAYTSRPDLIKKAVGNSLYILTAWEGEKLIGMLRAVGDGLTIIYIQDLILLKKYKRKGIGSLMLKKILEKYSNVRQIVLLTDSDKELITFYERSGFKRTDRSGLCSFIRIKNMPDN